MMIVVAMHGIYKVQYLQHLVLDIRIYQLVNHKIFTIQNNSGKILSNQLLCGC